MPIKRRTILHKRPEPTRKPAERLLSTTIHEIAKYKYMLVRLDGGASLYNERAEAIETMNRIGGVLWQYLGEEFDPNKPVDPHRRTPPTRGML